MKLSVVIPCYNEEENIPVILEKFKQVIKQDDIEIILVNNGSTDHSQQILDSLLPHYPFAKTLIVPVNQGYGFGILQGLNCCSGDYLGWTHADLQTDPADVIKALDLIEKQGNPKDIFIKGNRKNRPLFDRFFTNGMSIFESIYLGQILFDINAQPNIFSKEFFQSWEKPPFDFSLDLYVYYLAREKGLKIHRFNVLFPERLHGRSSWNTGLVSKWKFIHRTVSFSQNLKKEGIM